MYRTTRTTRTLATLGSGAVVSLVLCLPAGAADGGGPPVGVDVGAAKHGGIEAPSRTEASPPVDVGAAKHGGIEAPAKKEVERMLNEIDGTTGAPERDQSSSIGGATREGGLEYDQIVLAALGGVALTGVAVLVLRRRGEHHAPGLT